MPKPFIVYYRYKAPTEKSAPVRQYRVYADSLDEARKMVAGYANYPHIDVIEIKPA